MRAAEKDPGKLSDEHALTLITAEGELLTGWQSWPTSCGGTRSARR